MNIVPFQKKVNKMYDYNPMFKNDLIINNCTPPRLIAGIFRWGSEM